MAEALPLVTGTVDALVLTALVLTALVLAALVLAARASAPTHGVEIARAAPRRA